MTVKIQKIDDQIYLVNGKEVREDMDGNFLSKVELEPIEKKRFHDFITSEKLNELNNSL